MTRRPGVVIVVSQIPPPVHGSTVMTLRLLDALRQDAIPVELVDRRFSRSVGEVGRFSLKKVFRVPTLLARAAYAARPGRGALAVHFITNRIGSFFSDLLIAEVLRLMRIRRVDYVHTMGFKKLARRNRFMALLVRRLLSGATTTVCLSPSLIDDVVSAGGDEHRVRVVANTPEARSPRGREVKRDLSEPTVLFMSNLMPEKGATSFIEAARLVSIHHPNARFYIAGSSNDRSHMEALVRQADASELGDRLEFLGHLGGSSKWEALASADLLVFPSTYEYEAQPLTIVEALSVGTPIAAFNIGAIEDFFANREIGRLAPAGDVTALATCISEALASPECLRRWSSNALLEFEDRYSSDAFSYAWRAIIDESFR